MGKFASDSSRELLDFAGILIFAAGEMRIPASVRVSWRGFGGTFFAKKVPPIFVFPGLSA